MAAMRRCLVGQNTHAAGIAIRSFSTAPTTLKDELSFKPGSRYSVSGSVATIFGASGFLGRYVVNRLARNGTQCILPYRCDGMAMRHLKLNGDLGQVVPIPIDFVDKDSIRKALEKSNVVINLIGNDYVTRNYSYDDTHAKVTYRLAQLAAETGKVKKFIHVSALGADKDSPSPLLQSKAEGEEVVRGFFPEATIIRPAPIFGREDRLVNKIAEVANSFPFFPVVRPGQKLAPVFVTDVAMAIVNSLVHEDAPGNIVYACGPDTYTRTELLQFVFDAIYRNDMSMVTVPGQIGTLIGQICDKVMPIKFRVLSENAITSEQHDFLQPEKLGKALDLAALQINPRSLAQEISSIAMVHRGQRRPLVLARDDIYS